MPEIRLDMKATADLWMDLVKQHMDEGMYPAAVIFCDMSGVDGALVQAAWCKDELKEALDDLMTKVF